MKTPPQITRMINFVTASARDARNAFDAGEVNAAAALSTIVAAVPLVLTTTKRMTAAVDEARQIATGIAANDLEAAMVATPHAVGEWVHGHTRVSYDTAMLDALLATVTERHPEIARALLACRKETTYRPTYRFTLPKK